ncbi:transcriptional regulator, AraC family [Stigmatella aurantiaca]|uniref:Transcriptional regulator, AraC family n=1 Tax=Stigmatella aurantiaca TaxID=41 RepID=A0A1H7RIQ6_STIAU|nr:AraC family transcriptional regulator [Stigmatella aurantiaca]SEL60126.1 transcriptional regulator, AraC family [Stigmatella aurantiaca]
MRKTIAATVAARVYDIGTRTGVAPDAILRVLERPRAELAGDTQVPIETLYACFALCLRHTRDPGFPLQVAQAITWDDYSVLGFALMTSEKGTDAFARLARYGHLITDSGAWQFETRANGEARVSWVRGGERTLGHRAANECAIAELVCGLRRSYGDGFTPSAIRFAHREPADTRTHASFFRTRIHWEAEEDGIDVAAGALSTPAARHDAAMNRYFGAVLEAQDVVAASTSDRVRVALARGLSAGAAPAARVAVSLGLSERTLRRELEREGTTYRAVLEELRRSTALDLFRRGKNVTEVAFLLGFSETSALSRAMKRWVGVTPRSVRSSTYKPPSAASRKSAAR